MIVEKMFQKGYIILHQAKEAETTDATLWSVQLKCQVWSGINL